MYRSTMWWDWSNSTAVLRQAACSSRQFENSDGTVGIDVGSDLRIAKHVDGIAGAL